MRPLLLLALCFLSGCLNPQRIAEPLWLDDEEPVSTADSGSSISNRPVASVLRHSSPVEVQRPGAPDSYRIDYHDKRARLRSGASVIVGPGGRAELTWENDATSVVLFGEAVCFVGDPGRDQAMVRLKKVLAARLILTSEDRVELPGGAEFRAIGEGTSGPFRLKEHRDGILRLENQSKVFGEVRYRDEVLELAPGDTIDLPILSAGTAPVDPGPAPLETRVGGLLVESSGRIEPSILPGGAVRLYALEDGHVTVSGVRVQLLAGEEAIFSGLGPLPIESDSTPQE